MDALFYLGAAASSAVYCLILELLNKRLEPDFTWVEVVIGVALTGCWIAARGTLGDLPDVTGDAMFWWTCWLWVYMFLATGLPVVAWQIWQMWSRSKEALRYAVSRRNKK